MSVIIGQDRAFDVAVGSGGYLYLAGGAQSVYEYTSGKKSIPEEAFTRFNANLTDRKSVAEKQGARFVHCVCPDKQSVIPEHFPGPVLVRAGEEFAKRADVSFLYPVQDLRASGDTFGYLKTDTHWNFDGRYAITRTLLSALSIDDGTIANRHEDIFDLKKSYRRYVGDLGNKLRPVVSEIAEVAVDADERSLLPAFSNHVSGNNGSIFVHFNTGSKVGSKLLIFGDSFVLHCLPMLSLFFEATLFLRTPYLHREIVSMFQPTHLVTASAERYLPNTVRDADAPLGLLLAGLSGKAWRCDTLAYQAINAALQPRGPHARNFWAQLRSQ